MDLPTFPLSSKRRKILDKIRYKATGEREWISQSENLGQAFRRVSDRYADQIYVTQGEKELTPIARLSTSWADYFAPSRPGSAFSGLGNLPGGIPPDEQHERLQPHR